MVTRNIEDYIKGIYKLQARGEKVTTSALARHLGLRDASVTDMMKNLSGKKLIEYEPYRGVRLTKPGMRLALKTVRRHRLWEMFLMKFLGYSWDEVHDEAEVLEHVTSDELERRLDGALGFPKTDPHGDPIPDAKGEMPSTDYLRLGEAEAGRKYAIARVNDDSPEILQYLKRLGLELNKEIKVVEKMTFDGSVVIKAGARMIPLSSRVAEAISVQETEG